MPIAIHLLKLDQLRSLYAGSTQVDGYFVEEGALPEPEMIYGASERLKGGLGPTWNSFYLFIDENGRNAIGSGSFHSSPREGRVEIGYEVAAAYRRKGVATAAVRLMVAKAFRYATVSEVFAQSAIDNFASRKVLQKVGFRHAGKNEVRPHGLCDQWIIKRPFSPSEMP